MVFTNEPMTEEHEAVLLMLADELPKHVAFVMKLDMLFEFGDRPLIYYTYLQHVVIQYWGKR